MEVGEIADATGMVASDEAERSASNATNLDTLHASARRIRIFAIAATVSVTSRKIVSRLVPAAEQDSAGHSAATRGRLVRDNLD